MREVVNIHLGRCGNDIATQFWELLCNEHGLDRSGCVNNRANFERGRAKTFFCETKGLSFSPRAIIIDLDKSSVDLVRASPYGKIFRPDNFVFGEQGASNNWAKGHYSEGASLAKRSLDVIRKEVEACDAIHGFQVFHSIGGGTGGGLGSLLLSNMKDEYKDRIVNTYSIIPSPKVSNTVVEPYNAVLSLNHLVDFSSETYIMDNEALYQITSNILKLTRASFCDMNRLVSLAVSGITTCIRFSGPSNSDLRKIAVNMIPFPRLHFFLTGFAPICSRGNIPARKLSPVEITNEMFSPKNSLAACDPKKGKYLTAACIFRGQMSTRNVESLVYNYQLKNSPIFVEWIPDNIKTALCCTPPPGFSIAATFIGNTSAIKDVLARVRSQFKALLDRKAFLHWYTDEGLDENEFKEADSNVNDIVNEYKDNEK